MKKVVTDLLDIKFKILCPQNFTFLMQFTNKRKLEFTKISGRITLRLIFHNRTNSYADDPSPISSPYLICRYASVFARSPLNLSAPFRWLCISMEPGFPCWSLTRSKLAASIATGSLGSKDSDIRDNRGVAPGDTITIRGYMCQEIHVSHTAFLAFNGS